jgi:hypothetical protein
MASQRAKGAILSAQTLLSSTKSESTHDATLAS